MHACKSGAATTDAMNLWRYTYDSGDWALLIWKVFSKQFSKFVEFLGAYFDHQNSDVVQTF